MLSRLVTFLCVLFLPTLAHGNVVLGAGVSRVETTWFEEDSHFGAKAYADLGLLDYFALELAYLHLGRTSLPEWPDYGGFIDSRAYSVSARALFPWRHLALFGKIGIALWDMEGKLITIAGERSYSADGRDVLWGIGVEAAIPRSWYLRIEWERLDLDDMRAVRVQGLGASVGRVF